MAQCLCVSCVQLPTKDRALAIKTVTCPDCNNVFGVTSYGSAFRIAAAKRHMLLSPALLTGSIVGAGLLTFAIVMIGLGMWSSDVMITPKRAADPAPRGDLTRVPEVAVDTMFARNVRPDQGKQHITQLIARIRNDNSKKQDAFLLARMEERRELRGLPFVMGDACRMAANKAPSFQTSVEAVREAVDRDSRSVAEKHGEQHTPFWDSYLNQTGNRGIETDHGIAALTQILGPQPQSLRTSLVQKLAKSKLPEATKALAKAAVFDASLDVRVAAIHALKDRNDAQDVAIVNDVLMHGIRYPLPAVADRAANAMLALNRQEVVPQLVAFLGEPAPGDPAPAKVDDKDVCTVREVVKINHHRNCLLCHPPATTGQPLEVPGVMPIPGQSFSTSPKDAYGNAQSSGEPMVRADTTYLRQDFSVMMPVENAAPWPEMQRFDFLVRNRVVEGQELAELQQRVQQRGAGFQSENHKAATLVLQRLTGHQNVAPNQAAWQQVLAKGGE